VTDETRKIACTVSDGRFVEPCDGLAELVENPNSAFSRAKGITCWNYTNMETLKPSRRFYGVKSKSHPNGLLFNFCPLCGTDISAPFAGQDKGDD
jgi:hypothetical protein